MADPDPTLTPTPDPMPAPNPDPGTARTFSQEDVDRIVQERVARVKVTPPADYEELKAARTRLDEIEAANRTELENAQAALAAAEERAARIEVEAKETRLRSAIIAEAAKPDRKVVDPEAVFEALTTSKKDLLELGDDGAPTNIAKAMDSLLEQRPYLVSDNGGSRGSADQGVRGGGGNQLTREDLKGMSSSEIVQAQKEGRLAHLLQGSE